MSTQLHNSTWGEYIALTQCGMHTHTCAHTIHSMHTHTRTDTYSLTHRHAHAHTLARTHMHAHTHTINKYHYYCMGTLLDNHIANENVRKKSNHDYLFN